jgi:hypothetical protein
MPPKADLPPFIFYAIVGYYTKPSLQYSRSNMVIYHFEQVISIMFSDVMHSCSFTKNKIDSIASFHFIAPSHNHQLTNAF